MKTCKQCNTPIVSRPGDRPWTTQRRTFCSRKCAGIYTNSHPTMWNDEKREILKKYYYDGGYRAVAKHLPEFNDLQIMHEAVRLKLKRRPDWRKYRDFSYIKTMKRPKHREEYVPLPEEIKAMCEQIRKEREGRNIKRA